jgi:hypothetical protein
MTTFLAPIHLALTIIILVWDIVLAGRIAQNRQSSRLFQAVSGLAALLVLPGLLFTLATSTIMTGRAVAVMDWVWPAVLVLFAFQALYAAARWIVNPIWGLPILVYDIVIATIGVVRYMVAHGYTPIDPLVTLLASQSVTMVFVAGSPSAMTSPFFLNMPMVSPAFPALRNLTATFRLMMSAVAVVWVVLILVIGGPHAVPQLRNYDAHRRDQLRERPDADFAIGVKILPDLRSPPPKPAIKSDSALLDTLDVDAVAVVVVPGATKLTIDSLGKVLDAARSDSTVVIVAIGYRSSMLPELTKVKFDRAMRLATLRLAVARLHPTIVLPAEDPYGSGERALGALPPNLWESYLAEAARVAKSVDRKVRVGVSASAYTPNDSTLYAWAATPGSPMDVVGFSLFPTAYTGGDIETDTRTADRWMRATPPRKDHWVFGTGGYPLAFGERSQEEAVWQALAWATDHPAIKGAIVYEAGDYGETRGLVAPNGRLRPAARTIMRAIQQLRESAK